MPPHKNVESTLIWYKGTDYENYKTWTEELDSFLSGRLLLFFFNCKFYVVISNQVVRKSYSLPHLVWFLLGATSFMTIYFSTNVACVIVCPPSAPQIKCTMNCICWTVASYEGDSCGWSINTIASFAFALEFPMYIFDVQTIWALCGIYTRSESFYYFMMKFPSCTRENKNPITNRKTKCARLINKCFIFKISCTKYLKNYFKK